MEASILTILIAVPSAAFTAFAMWLIAQRRIEVENVTQERAKWRGQVRELNLQVHDAILRNQDNKKQLKGLRSQLTVLLNPTDAKDRKILDSITEGSNGPEERAEEFAKRISLLLKHDWERAKLETGFPLCRWTLEAVRHRMNCTKKQGCTCKVKNEVRLCGRYKFRKGPTALLLGVILIAALSIIGGVLCHCFGPSETKHRSMHVLAHGGMDDGVIHGSR